MMDAPTHVITYMKDGREIVYAIAYDRVAVQDALAELARLECRAMPVPYATWLARGLDTGGRL